MKWLDKIFEISLIAGAINWGAIGIGVVFNKSWNLVKMLASYLGTWANFTENLIYIIVGVAGVMAIYKMVKKKN